MPPDVVPATTTSPMALVTTPVARSTPGPPAVAMPAHAP